MMTYRSATEWVQRFGREPVSPDLREDGPFVEAGENDNLIVQKVAADPMFKVRGT